MSGFRRGGLSIFWLIIPPIVFFASLASAGEQDSMAGALLYAHRGVAVDSPENSLASVKAAMDLGLYGTEVDLRTARDGGIVLMHDETVERTSTGQGRVADKTLDELKSFFLKMPDGRITTEKIPALEELLALVESSTDFTLTFDMKKVDALAAARAVLEKDMVERVFFFIADPIKDAKTAKELKALDSRLQIAVALLSWWKIEGLPTFVTYALDADALFAPEWFFPEFGFQEAHRAGARVFVYLWGTCDLPEKMRRAVELGADVVSSDRPDYLIHEEFEAKANLKTP